MWLPGLTFSVNLNDLFKDLYTSFNDARDRIADLKQYEAQFKRQMSQSRALLALLEDDALVKKTDLSKLPAEQIDGLRMSIKEAEDLWQMFNHLLDRHRVAPAGLTGVTRPFRWTLRDKKQTEQLLADLRQVNTDIKDDITTFVSWFPNTSASSSGPAIEANQNARLTGISQSIQLRRTWHNTFSYDKSVLIEPLLLSSHEPASDNRLGVNLYKAVLGRRTNVLVEHRYYHQHQDSVEVSAIQLATFLQLEKPPSMKVLRCIGAYHHPQTSSYGIVLNLQPLALNDAHVTDSTRTSLAAVLPALTNLRSQLVKSNTSAVFRYSRLGGDPAFPTSPTKYLSLSDRLSFAASLAETIYQIFMVDWLHQNIRGENIWFNVCAERHAGPTSPVCRSASPPYLCNFEFARPSKMYSDTPSLKHFNAEANLTRHPARQLDNRLVPHQMEHDIYSFGIVLLEIGLGRTIKELYDYLKTVPLSEGQEPNPGRPRGFVDEAAEQRRRHIVQGAAILLPERMGDKYTDITLRCLRRDFFHPDDDSREEHFELGLEGARDEVKIFRRYVKEELELLAETVRGKSLDTTDAP